MARKKKRRSRSPQKKRTYNKNCEQCGKAFIATRAHAKYCSPKCRRRAYIEGRKASTQQSVLRFPLHGYYIKDCGLCGWPFACKREDAEFCSNKCRQAKWRWWRGAVVTGHPRPSPREHAKSAREIARIIREHFADS